MKREGECQNVARETWVGMHTGIHCTVCGDAPAAAISSVRAEMKRLESLLSRHMRKSDICGINLQAGKGSVPIALETVEILSCAARISGLADGSFSVAIGPLVDLWDYGHASHPPEAKQIGQVLGLLDWHDVLLDAQASEAGLRSMGQSIDLGGIAKGYAGDRCVQLLHASGASSAFVSIGGNVSLVGCRPTGEPWRVGVRHPRIPDQVVGILSVSDVAVVTSGDYERFFIDRYGRRWHHILDPATGYPAQSHVIGVTVVHPEAMIADALSTTLFIKGIEDGLELLDGFDEAEAVLIDDRLHLYVTRGLSERFSAACGAEYTIV